MLPPTVLISPLCAMNRLGCARSHDGKVLVENREWIIARWLSKSVSARSGKKGKSWLAVSIPL
ncbi:hypothetical protein D3C83_139870 [compost metagenome]